ncbi:MAG: hypothetical protein L0K86_24745 [Actinomycetia bacterium]|nr:hypothetical protein [Actinomycetes bacterium]
MITTVATTSRNPRTTARPVPRWAVVAAHAAALTPVLSFLWRLPLMVGVPMGMDDAFMDDMMSHPLWARAAYLIGLGVLAEGLAFLTLGLVRPWGEIVPRWVPALRGRAIPAWAVVTIATSGGLFATLMFTVAGPFAWPGNFTHVDAWVVLQTLCYVPLVAWGPLVLAVTWAYWRRRR